MKRDPETRDANKLMRALGKTQEAVLRSLREHGTWSRGCGWRWTTNGETEKIMDSLVKRGLATVTEEEINYKRVGTKYARRVYTVANGEATGAPDKRSVAGAIPAATTNIECSAAERADIVDALEAKARLIRQDADKAARAVGDWNNETTDQLIAKAYEIEALTKRFS